MLGLSLGPTAAAMRAAGRHPPGATLALDFLAWRAYAAGLGAPALGALLQTARSAAAGHRGADGRFREAAANTPRRDHSAAGAPLGLRCEGPATYQGVNSLLAGAAAGSPGTLPTGWSAPVAAGLTRTIAIDDAGGLPRLRIRYAGAPAANFQFILQMLPAATLAAAAGQTWTPGLYMTAAGTGLPACGFGIWETDAGGAILRSTNVPVTPGAAWTRRSQTVTLGAGTAFLRLLASTGIVAAGTACDFEIAVGGATLTETGRLPSERLVGTAAAARDGDGIHLPTGAWFNPLAGTLLTEWVIPQDDPAAAVAAIASLNDGTAGNRVTLHHAAASDRSGGAVLAAGVPSFDATAAPAYVYGAVRRHALAWAADGAEACVDGVLSAADATVTPPAGLVRLDLGAAAPNASPLDGWLRRVTYWPTRRSGAEMQADQA